MSEIIKNLVPVRVMPSSGDTTIVFSRLVTTSEGKQALEQWTLGNDFGGHWVTFPAMTQFHVISAVEKTDTWCLAVEIDGQDEPKGLVLRRKAYENLKLAVEGQLQEFLIKKAMNEAAKAKTTAAKTTTSKAPTKAAPKVIEIAVDPIEAPAPEAPAAEATTTETKNEEAAAQPEADAAGAQPEIPAAVDPIIDAEEIKPVVEAEAADSNDSNIEEVDLDSLLSE